MCGIAGAVFWNPADAPQDPVSLVARMTDVLAHRGPDGHGITPCGRRGDDAPIAVFGHRRLAIIDLSERARQPMARAPRGLSITYNGEIYNHRALRRELEIRGRVFTSSSDTEVILQGYDEWGIALLDRLQGMFAFAIWDAATGELLLARDRLGIKPLYVAEGAGHLVFASEVRALLASGLVAREIDPVSLAQYLAYQTVPAPRTLVRHVRLLLPGHLGVARPSGRLESRAYWDLLDSRSAEGADAAVDYCRQRLSQLLTDAMTSHLVSDVPVGVFLSGGIDSSALVSLAVAAGHVPHTFAVTFPNAPEDEASFARTVASHFQTDHTEIPIRPADALAGVHDALVGLDQPSGDGVNTFLVSRAVRSAGLKVALSGLGGDELFGGYPSFTRLDRLSGYALALRRTPVPARQMAAAAVKIAGRSSVASSKVAALIETDGSLPEAFPILRQLFGPAERDRLLTPRWHDAGAEADPYVTLLRDATARHADAGPVTLTSFAEARTYMHDLLLRDTDQMSMHHGLEVRVPLLDHRVVEFVMGLRDEVKRPAGRPKRLLTDSLPQPLPPAVVARRKQGFVVPLGQWMRAELRETCETHLGPRGLGGHDAFQPASIGGLWRAFLAGDRRTSWSRLWTLVALGAWLEQHALEARL
jgi:asparagine synthase (glutamine-hydrolysing)